MRNKTMERFFDDDDFTASHDEIFEHLIAHWVDYILPLMDDKDCSTKIHGSICGEPALDGYPPLFPDAIATGFVNADHRTLLLEPTFNIASDYPHNLKIHYKCSKCSREYVQDEQLDSRPTDAKELTEWDKKVADIKQRHGKPLVWHDLCKLFDFQAVFEIKPNKESAGRILRQLNIYRERLNNNNERRYDKRFMILITPDSRFDSLFRSQGVIPVRPILPLAHWTKDIKREEKGLSAFG